MSPWLSMVSPPHRPPFPCPDLAIDVPGHGKVVVDISYGGTFYAFLSAEQLGLDVCSSKTRDLVNGASAVTEAVKKQVWRSAAVPQCVPFRGDCTRVRPFIPPRHSGWEGVPPFQPHVELQGPPPASQGCGKELTFLLLHLSLLLEKQRWKRSTVASSPSSGRLRKLCCTHC